LFLRDNKDTIVDTIYAIPAPHDLGMLLKASFSQTIKGTNMSYSILLE
jgi:hypothetical protein